MREREKIDDATGGILGLLITSEGGESSDVLRLAGTFNGALKFDERFRFRGLPTIVELPVVHLPKVLHAPPSELSARHLELLDASDTCDLKKVEAHQPLSEYVDTLEKIRGNRNVAFSTVRERERDLVWTRFQKVARRRDVVSAVQACPFEGSESLGQVRPPTGVILRLDGEGSDLPADHFSSVLVGRPAWRKALEDVRLPKFGETKVVLAELVRLSTTPFIRKDAFDTDDVSKNIVAAVIQESNFGNVRDVLRFLGVGAVPVIGKDTLAAIVKGISKGEDRRSQEDDVEYVFVQGDVEKRVNDVLARLEASVIVMGGGGEKRAPAAPAAPAAKRCDLDVLPERPLTSWIRDPSPEAPKAPENPNDTLAAKAFKVQNEFWEKYDAAPDTLGASQGHLVLAQPVLVVLDSVPLYDHIRAIEPRGICLSEAAKRTMDRENAFGSDEEGNTPDSRETRTVYAHAWSALLSSKDSTFFGVKAKAISVGGVDFLEERDGALELGIEDVFHYYAVGNKGGEKKAEEGDEPTEGNEQFQLLREIADLLGISPALNVSEERTLLDELEYHLPGGEGEQAKVLRRRIEDVKRRRNVLMAKAGVAGKAYEAVEKRLIARLRADAYVSILVESVSFLAALLDARVGDRIAEAPSGSLRACLATADKRVKNKNKNKNGITRASLVACAASTVISTRCPPDSHPPSEALPTNLGKRIAEIEATFVDKGQYSSADASENKNRSEVDESNPHFLPLTTPPREKTLSDLWKHVASSPAIVEGQPVNPVSSCCSYTAKGEESVWSSLKIVPTTLRAGPNLAIAGIQPAGSIPTTFYRPKTTSEDQTFLAIRSLTSTFIEPLKSRGESKKKRGDRELVLDELRKADATLENELVPPSGSSGLVDETTSRFDALTDGGGETADYVRGLIAPKGPDDVPLAFSPILESFLRSELAPTLRRMSAPTITERLSADAEIAKCAADLRENETRDRFSALSDAAAAAANLPSMKGQAWLLGATTTFLLWALSTSGRALPQKSSDAARHAADLLLSRLAARFEFDRGDQREADASKVKAIKEALRAERRAALDKLTDEERELWGERKKAIRGTPDIPDIPGSPGSPDVSEEVTEDADVLPIENGMEQGEVVEDASDAFF